MKKTKKVLLITPPYHSGVVESAGVWLNVGHGSSGWTLSCGSARVVADLISGRTPAIDLSRLGIERMR